ncbi:MAG: cryptochrome/photolyase family protein [Anaerolineae bacterium]|nr:cryptochrome/photolyase family protein [Thermoflexales bacterium]MDW8408328.1 cryptochrome/photolyase family protein [Anaerolineae bacterium]
MLHSMRPTVWVLGDQLSPRWPAWLAEHGLGPDNARLLCIESERKLRARPWHRHKLILVLSAMRHFVEEMRRRGFDVEYRRAPTFLAGLRAHLRQHSVDRLIVMRPNTWQGAQFTSRLEQTLGLPVEVWPNRFFLAGPSDLGTARSPLMETFYRKMRRRTGFLMDGPQPVGSRWNWDAENRRPPRKDWQPADLPAIAAFPPDEITRQVIEEVARIDTAWGRLDGFALPVTRADALAFYEDFLVHRLPAFGPYQDAMLSGRPWLFHALISPLINIGLLEAGEVCAAAEQRWRDGRAPLNSVEGFIRQVIGWREFMYAVYWREMPALRGMNALGAVRPLPAFYWSAETEMVCLRECVQSVWERGYTHHIQRLMVLCNFAMLAGVDPHAVNDWFLSTYVDAYDWVVTPNVIGMGLFADGGIVGSKPYAASANYIHKMSDYCAGCRFNPRQRVGPNACPFNALYWDFVIRHAGLLGRNPRTSMAVKTVRRMNGADVAALRAQAASFLEHLAG